MSGTYQSLVDLYVYKNKSNAELICEIYFKGRFDPFAISPIENLLGDLFSMQFRDYQEENVHVIEFNNLISNLTALIFDKDRSPEDVGVLNEYFLSGRHSGEKARLVHDFEELNELYDRLNDFARNHETDVQNIPTQFQFVADATPIKSPAPISQTIIDCFAYDEGQVDEYAKIYKFLMSLENRNIAFSERVFSALLFSTGVCLPPCIAFDATGIKEGTYQRTLALKPANDRGIDLLEGDFSRYAFHYECSTFCGILTALLHYIAVMGRSFKRCQNCGRWFFPKKKSDEKYCGFLTNGKTCKELVTSELRKKRLQSKPIYKKYNSVNTKLANRVNATQISEAERIKRDAELVAFREEWRKKKKILSDEELNEWLESFSFKDRISCTPQK